MNLLKSSPNIFVTNMPKNIYEVIDVIADDIRRQNDENRLELVKLAQEQESKTQIRFTESSFAFHNYNAFVQGYACALKDLQESIHIYKLYSKFETDGSE